MIHNQNTNFAYDSSSMIRNKPALKMVQKQAEYLKGIQEQVALVEKELAAGLDKTELRAR